MIQGVTFVSRKTAEDMMPDPGVGMISITDPDTRQAAIRDGWGAVLRLEFHDIDHQPSCYSGLYGYELMSVDQGRELLAWLEENEGGLSGMVVHCEQGISRSAAVAKFLGERYGLTVDENDVRFHNKYVYRLLVDLAPPGAIHSTEQPTEVSNGPQMAQADSK